MLMVLFVQSSRGTLKFSPAGACPHLSDYMQDPVFREWYNWVQGGAEGAGGSAEAVAEDRARFVGAKSRPRSRENRWHHFDSFRYGCPGISMEKTDDTRLR